MWYRCGSCPETYTTHPVLLLAALGHVALLVDVREVEVVEARDNRCPGHTKCEVDVWCERHLVRQTARKDGDCGRHRVERRCNHPLEIGHRFEYARSGHCAPLSPAATIVVFRVSVEVLLVVGRRVGDCLEWFARGSGYKGHRIEVMRQQHRVPRGMQGAH